MNKIPDHLLPSLSDLVASAIGWDFPPPRWEDLRRGLNAAIAQLGFDNPAEGAFALLNNPLSPQQIDALARALTVGETYFFRDRRAFDFLAERVLPAWIHSRRQRRLRIWSAACCTGEEPYSIAMLLQQIIPDFQQWDISILATDINRDFLHRAEAGCFGPWSFRNVPTWIIRKYFHPSGQASWQIGFHIRQMVRFAHLNLMDESSMLQVAGLAAADLIFCRNVLMYFTPENAKKVIANFHRAQAESGWLLVGPTESPHGMFAPYQTVHSDGIIAYHKHPAPLAIAGTAETHPSISSPPAPMPEMKLDRMPTPLRQPDLPAPRIDHSTACSSIHLLSNQGKFPEALGECDRWIEADRLNPSSHYTRAVLLLEQNAVDQAVASLQRVLYIDPGFVLAHFALANIARARCRGYEAAKHMDNTLRSLRKLPPAHLVPESGGITAQRLTEMIGANAARKAAA